MSVQQKKQLRYLLAVFYHADKAVDRKPEFHHGGAVGADTEADGEADRSGYRIHLHPSPGVLVDDASTIWRCKRCGDATSKAETCSVCGGSMALLPDCRGRFNGHDVEWRQALPPLARNRHIVTAADVLIAAPSGDREQLRSGTWATIRYARSAGIPVIMLSRGKE